MNKTRILLATSLICLLAGCAPRVRFEHGVASGDPLADAVILWTRVTPESLDGPVTVRWQIAENEDLASVVRSGELTAEPVGDYTVKVDAVGLEPGRTYFYRFRSGNAVSPVGRTRTLPSGPVEQLEFAVLSCTNYPAGFFNVYRAVAERPEIDAVLHLGDYIYEYGRGGYASQNAAALGREVDPEGELLTLDDYRRRYAQYKADPDSQEIHRLFPFITVWDDHELANNAWLGGAQNHDDGEGPWAERRSAAVQAYLEWMPIRPQEEGADALGKTYRSFELGDLASLIMLDTRLIGRDQQLTYGRRLDEDLTTPAAAERFLRHELGATERSILGGEQEDWLRTRLRASRDRGATWQIVGQQLLVAPVRLPELDDLAIVVGDEAKVRKWVRRLMRQRQLGLPWNLDSWDGYPAARERFYRDVKENARNLVVLSGDTHNSWAFELSGDDGEHYGVELATPSVTSPGMEGYLPLEPEKLLRGLRDEMPHLVYGNGTDRGYLLLRLTRQEVTAEWHYVDTITHRDFTERCEKALTVAADAATEGGRLRETPTPSATCAASR